MKALHAQVANIIPFSWVDGPGNRFVIFLQGCNYNCLACHNPQTIPMNSLAASNLTLEEILDQIRDSMPYISGLTISGGEATIQYEFIYQLFCAIKGRDEFKSLSTFIDSNGNASSDVWNLLAPVTDGVMLDLKALDEEAHIQLTGHSNRTVLESIKTLTNLGKIFEVRLLLIPGLNDSKEELTKTAIWLRKLDPLIRIKVNAFRAHGVRGCAKQWPEASEFDLARYETILK